LGSKVGKRVGGRSGEGPTGAYNCNYFAAKQKRAEKKVKRNHKTQKVSGCWCYANFFFLPYFSLCFGKVRNSGPKPVAVING